MKISIEGDKEYAKQLLTWIKVKTLTVGQGIRSETKELLKLIIQFTPPQKGKKQGEAAVSRDIQRTIYPLVESSFDNKAIRSLIRRKDYAGLTKLLKNFSSASPAYNTQALPLDPSVHQRGRNRRGVVTQHHPSMSTPDVADVRSYIRDRYRAVGQARGGFAAGVEKMGGSTAQWISRHKHMGTCVDNSNHVLFPHVIVTNKSRWSSSGDEDRIVANAVNSRTSIIRNKIEDALQKASKKTGLA